MRVKTHFVMTKVSVYLAIKMALHDASIKMKRNPVVS